MDLLNNEAIIHYDTLEKYLSLIKQYPQLNKQVLYLYYGMQQHLYHFYTDVINLQHENIQLNNILPLLYSLTIIHNVKVIIYTENESLFENLQSLFIIVPTRYLPVRK